MPTCDDKNNLTTLVILAAGQGSRFGGPKQFKTFGPKNITLMQYNIEHALQCGFTKIIFIIRAEHQDILQQMVIEQLPKSVETDIVCQTFNNIPNTCLINKNRTKPLGTAHALWCAKAKIKGDFVVINADDYYGKQGFQLVKQPSASKTTLVAFQLKNTLSEHGGVNRAICQLSPSNDLLALTEFEDISSTSNGIYGTHNKKDYQQLNETDLVSMNFWRFSPEIFPLIESHLRSTFTDLNNLKVECYLPDVVKLQLSKDNTPVRVLTSQDAWFGVTYAADSVVVESALSE